MNYKVKIDICEQILAGDEVKIVPSYSYMIGTDTRISDYFQLKSGEVVISKIKNTEGPDMQKKMVLSKCNRKDLQEIK